MINKMGLVTNDLIQPYHDQACPKNRFVNIGKINLKLATTNDVIQGCLPFFTLYYLIGLIEVQFERYSDQATCSILFFVVKYKILAILSA